MGEGRGLLIRVVAPNGQEGQTWVRSFEHLRSWAARLDTTARHDLVTNAHPYEVVTPAYFARCLADFEKQQSLRQRSAATSPPPSAVQLRLRLPVGPPQPLLPAEVRDARGTQQWSAADLGRAADEPAVVRQPDEWKPVELQRYALAASPPPRYHAIHAQPRAQPRGGSPLASPNASLHHMSGYEQGAPIATSELERPGVMTSELERPRSPSTPGDRGARFIQEEWNYDVVARGEELLESLVAGNFETVDALLNGCWDVSVRHASTGDTALHLVAKLAISPLGLRILEHGSDVQALNAAYETPLLLAVQHQRCYQLAGALLKKHADPNTVANDGTTPLMRAVESMGEDPSRLCELLLAFRAHPDMPGPDGAAPLHKAASRGDARTCAVLLASGADPQLSIPKEDGAQHEWVTPLYLASIHGHPDVIEVLADFGACAR